MGGIGWRAKGKKGKAEEEEGSEGLKVEGLKVKGRKVGRSEEASRGSFVAHWLADEGVCVLGEMMRFGVGGGFPAEILMNFATGGALRWAWVVHWLAD